MITASIEYFVCGGDDSQRPHKGLVQEISNRDAKRRHCVATPRINSIKGRTG